MSDHTPAPFERHVDVVIVGGSAAGLAAALQLGRQRRSVMVIDAGEPRNAPAAHMHSFLGREGQPPSELVAAGREEVRSYGGEILEGRVRTVTRDGHRFRASLDDGRTVLARRVLAATGLVDELPDIEGLAEHWGRDVIHCPFCHGYEARDGRIVQIVTHPMALHTAPLFRQLTARLTVVVHGDVAVDPSTVEALVAAGVPVEHGLVQRVVADADGRVRSVEVDGRQLEADAVVVSPPFRVRAEPFEPLGLPLTAHPRGLGEVVETDASGQTAVPGLYAAGNVTDPSHQVLQAAADGSRVGGMISFDLAEEDLTTLSRPMAGESDWDERYGDEHIWSGNPNGALVHEVDAMAPGRALDIGAGEGGDAIWLAERGWRVTATDISQRALDRVDAEATRRGLEIECRQVDANAGDAFEPLAYDLVTAHYASIPRTPDDRAVHNLLDAVAPGGVLLVVSHDLEPMLANSHGRPFDPLAFVQVDHVATALADAPDWDVEVHELRPRPPGAAAAASHHVDDVVLRARRRAR